MEQQGLIYDPTAYARINDFLSSQEEELKKIDNNSENQKQNIIRYSVILGVSALAILMIKIIVKKKK